MAIKPGVLESLCRCRYPQAVHTTRDARWVISERCVEDMTPVFLDSAALMHSLKAMNKVAICPGTAIIDGGK